MEYSFLDPNEMVILLDEGVRNTELKKTGNLMLTNKNIIFFTVGSFKGKIKEVHKFPLTQVKKYQNQAQAKVFNKNFEFFLDIYFVFGNQRYSFINRIGKKRITEWVKAINSIIVGDDIQNDSTQYSGIPGVNTVIGAVQDTLGTISGKFKNNSNKIISAKCKGCGAPLTGHKGQIVQCQYCDTKQEL